MKKLFTMMLAASISAMAFAGTPVKQSELPKAAQTFLSKYFPGDNVKKAEKEEGRRGNEYDVDLVSGAEVEFFDNGEWKEVEAAKGKAVPAAIVPDAIAKLVADNYKGLSIIKISHKRGGYEIKLSNGEELKLTQDAKPIADRPMRPDGQRPMRRGHR